MKLQKKPLIPYLIISLVLAFLTHRAYALYSIAPEPDMTNLFSQYTFVLEKYVEPPYFYPNFSPFAILAAMVGFFIGMMFFLKIKPAETLRHGEEAGSARFATAQELSGFKDSEPTNNMIFTKNAQMGLFNKNLPFQWQLNKNVLVVGLPGDGKTFTYVKPNLMQMNSSFIVTDPKGLLVRETGKMLEEHGYQVKVFDLVNLTKSDMFNPFHYMKSELDIDRITEAIVEGSKKGDREGEDFWNQAKLLLNRALIGYLYFDSQVQNYTPNLSMVSELLRNMKRPNEKEPSPVEKMFANLEKAMPGNYACRQWDLFNSNFEAETRTSVLAIVATQYSIFDHQAVTNLIMADTMEMDTWNTEKTAVFVAISETNKAYSFLASTLFTVMFDQLTHNADAIIQGKKDGYTADDLVHVQFIFDEFANIGKIPHFNEVLASIRSREMSVKIIIQAISQLDTIYGDKARKSMVNNCATLLFLGTNDEDTMRYFSMRAGKQTITQKSYSEQRGQRVSGSTSTQAHQRDLMTPDEIARIGVDEALVFISKQNVLRDKKAMVTDHPMKDELSDNPNDGKWYNYIRFMVEDPELFNAVRDGEIKPENVWYPDMKDYDQFIQDNEIDTSKPTEAEVAKVDEVSVPAEEEPVYEQVPVQFPEMSVESQSQTQESEIKAVDFATGEIFELPPEDEEDGEYYGEV
ncbi:VirD4-like conjugal transfer protein, CD1115 family [Streptococcus thermophilus]|uniref:Type IV secretion system protein VirD4 n=1 Tax=Streptococcus thermophilus TaxID=1308 RepID=A0A8D6UBD7_STRTR|nr:type IV secretory system conjugative DNA transfer family protein [Streptococcus thermophilus]CAD0140127.1 Type IV secretion system protein VirD4 [Streptococcus thermophilus]CAD0146235.1 Type IV secretion system protein VirD4 [Streptococcus thermophilus]CAD0153252.1 Type IV secretion system protein VirD4 [Streptococcus thermophilus]